MSSETTKNKVSDTHETNRKWLEATTVTPLWTDIVFKTLLRNGAFTCGCVYCVERSQW